MNTFISRIHTLSLIVACMGMFYPVATEAAALVKPPNNLGLMGYWSFNENTGTIATDFSGNGNHATLASGSASPTWAMGKRGSALSFDNSDDYASVPDSSKLNITGALTIAFWVKRSSVGEFEDWFGKGIGASDRIQYFVSGHNDEFYFQFCTDALAACTAAHARQSTNANQVTGRWYHIAITYDDAGNNIALYQDGVPLSESDLLGSPETSSIISTSHPLRIGEMYSGDFTAATFDELRVYNRVLTQSQVQALYQASAARVGASTADLQKGSSLENGLVGLWTFDGADVTANDILDRSGNGNRGGFLGGATSSAKTIGKLGQALNFNGSSNYINAGSPSSLDNLTNITISAWIKPDADIVEGVIIAKVNNGGVNPLGPDFWIDDAATPGYFELRYAMGLTSHGAWRTSGQVVLGQWSHVVVTYSRSSDTNDPTFYINNVLQTTIEDTAPSGSPSDDSGEDIGIGVYGAVSNPAAYFKGVIDDLRIYNRQLTAAEVKQLYNLGTLKLPAN